MHLQRLDSGLDCKVSGKHDTLSVPLHCFLVRRKNSWFSEVDVAVV